ncbi:MAG: heparinase II/III family protein, partial [Planctomycetota bacterium]
MKREHVLRAAFGFLVLVIGASWGGRARGADVFPPSAKLVEDHPRVMLRPKATPHATSLKQLEGLERDAEFKKVLGRLRGDRSAAAQAMVWLLTGDDGAAQKAIQRMRTYKAPGKPDAFDVWFRLREFGLAYDWLHGHSAFTEEAKAAVRRNAAPLVKAGIRIGDDHVFHNYVWMTNSGMALWALAAAGDDPAADRLLRTVQARFNDRLCPAMEYQNGLPGDALGYWYHYCLSPFAWAMLGIGSAFETDVAAVIEEHQNDWLERQLEGLVLSTLPDMRFIPWGDMQRASDGGVTHQIAGPVDAITRATESPAGAWFGRWLAEKRGVNRFFRDHGLFYFLVTRHLDVKPAEPPLAMRAGGAHSGHALMRSSWKDDATIVGLRCTDHYSGHDHYDQGTFFIYRNGPLALDAGTYDKYNGPQLRTDAHNTLLLGGKGQRKVRATWFKDLAAYRKNLDGGRRLEQGGMPFFKHAGPWTAAACEFAHAYPPGTVRRCARQLLFVRPGTVVVVDNLVAAEGKKVPEAAWLLQVPARAPEVRE